MDEALVALRISYDAEADAAYLYLRDIEDGGVARTAPGVDSPTYLDFDAEGRLIGIEVLNATDSMPAELLDRVRERGSGEPRRA